MKKILFVSFICFIFVFVSIAPAQVNIKSDFRSSLKNKNKEIQKQPVLLELFTAEGCFNCPPAEKLLARLETEQPFEKAELITLAFHVDYWDSSGWTDRFASPLYSQRQRVYDRKFRTGSIYTPQMVVDGKLQFIGSKRNLAEKAIKKSIKNEKAKISLKLEGRKLSIKIKNMPEHDAASIYVAIAEDGLGSMVENGFNKGKELRHVSVVRELKGVGRIMPEQNSFEIETYLQFNPDWKKENLKIIVFIQENRKRIVHGVERIKLKITSDDRK